MDAKDLNLAERVRAAADDAKPSIHQLSDLHWSARSKLPDLKKLFDDLRDLRIIVETLHNNRDGFLGRNIEDQQQFLKECHCLLTSSGEVYVKLHDALEDVMQDSSFWRRVKYHEIQGKIDANRLYVTQLRIWTMTLDFLIGVMQFNCFRTGTYKAQVERAIKEVRNGLGIIDQKITQLLSFDVSQSRKMCELADEVLDKNLQKVAKNTVIDNQSDFTLAGQIRAESRWIREPKL